MALEVSKNLGCNIININPHDLTAGTVKKKKNSFYLLINYLLLLQKKKQQQQQQSLI